jgi:DNA-binding CsgD family transcriptional regulator
VAAELGATSWHSHYGCFDGDDAHRAVNWMIGPSEAESDWLNSDPDAIYSALLRRLRSLVKEYRCDCDEIVTRKWDSPRLGLQNVIAWIAVRPDDSCECIEFCKNATDGDFTARDEAILRVLSTELLAQAPAQAQTPEADATELAERPRLPRRQREVLAGLLSGSSVKEIAGELGISPYTVNDYIKALYRRFDVSSRGELLAAVHGLRPLNIYAIPARPK